MVCLEELELVRLLLSMNLLKMLLKLKEKENLTTIFTGIGERSREGEELYRELVDAKLINSAMLYFASNEWISRFKNESYLFSYNIGRIFQRYIERGYVNVYLTIFIVLPRLVPSFLHHLVIYHPQSGYQPTLMTEISNVQERLSNSQTGSITSFETVFVPADDITDPATVNIFSHLDGSLVLDRTIAASGKYPAISPLQSSSNNLRDELIGERHVKAVIETKKISSKIWRAWRFIGNSWYWRYFWRRQELLLKEQENYQISLHKISSRQRSLPRIKAYWFQLKKQLKAWKKIIAGDFDDVDPSEISLYFRHWFN